jgi:hypothetical protein
VYGARRIVVLDWAIEREAVTEVKADIKSEKENQITALEVSGLNNNIRVFQRRAYGLKDEEYLRLKVLSCMLPVLCPLKTTHSISGRP